MEEKIEFDFSPQIANIDKVREKKKAKIRKQNESIKPLKFEIDPEDSPLKAELIRRINERNLTYSDMYNYCAEKLENGDVKQGERTGYNIIYGLRKRHTMIDTTFLILCDFLNLDINLSERKTIEGSEDEDEL